MIAVHCVRRAGEPPPPPGLRGPGGAPVRLREEAGLGAWYSDAEPGPPDAARLLAHDRVVREALRSSTPLPVRYGTRLADEAALAAMLASRAGELLATLERVAGRVEMGLRLRWRGPPEPGPDPAERGPAASGREYLERRREALARERTRRERAEAAAAAAEAAFAPLALPTVRRLLPDPETAALVAHLVQKPDLDHYRTLALAARAALPELDVVVSGPWAPYSFV